MLVRQMLGALSRGELGPVRELWKAVEVADGETRAELYRINLRRLLLLSWIMGALVAVYAALFWPFGLEPDGPQTSWRRLVGLTHLYFLAWWIAVAMAVRAARRWPVRSLAVRALQFFVAVGGLLFCVALTVIDQKVTPNTSPFLIGSIGIGLLMLLSPTMSAAVHACGYLALFCALPLTQRDEAVLLSNRADGLTISVISVLLGAMLWRKDASMMMARKVIEEKNDELKHAAEHDALTGLLNRAELLRRAKLEIQRSRSATEISAVMLDLDHFKRINDTYGHQAGDAVLVEAARLLAQNVRKTDLLGRMGGEEFMIVLPGTGNAAAVEIANELCAVVRGGAFGLPGGGSVSVTASCGVSSIGSSETRDLDWLYASADHALYEAKLAGRNRVSTALALKGLSTSDFQRLR
jgi:diguanylate cyclase (GGDEF)-like protein